VLWSVWGCIKKNALQDMGLDSDKELGDFGVFGLGYLKLEGCIIPSLYAYKRVREDKMEQSEAENNPFSARNSSER